MEFQSLAASTDLSGEGRANVELDRLVSPSQRSLAVLILAAAGSCASVPKITEETANSEPPPVPIVSTLGVDETRADGGADFNDFTPEKDATSMPLVGPSLTVEPQTTDATPPQLAAAKEEKAEAQVPSEEAVSEPEANVLQPQQTPVFECKCDCDGGSTIEPESFLGNGKLRKFYDISIMVLSALGIFGILRNTGKVFNWAKREISDKKNFITGHDLSASPIYLHHFEDDTGIRVKIYPNSIGRVKPASVIDNKYAEKVYDRAMKLCTTDQSFPSLNIPYAMKSFLGRMFSRNTDPRPEDFRGNAKALVFLRELSKLFRDYYSSLYLDGAIAAESGDKRVVKGLVCLIPLCEVEPTVGRDRQYIAISLRNFRRFGDPLQVEKLRHDNPKMDQRISQLEQAYRIQHEFMKIPREERMGNRFFFPLVFVRVKARGSENGVSH